MEKKLVSILIPCYNSEKYLIECLDAILNQTYKNIELIIVNDGSTDNSESIIDDYIKKFKKKKMILKKINQDNQGQAAACNNGLKFVKGDYLYWQDSDDVLELDAIESMVDFLEKNENYDLVRGNVAFRAENNFSKIINIGKPISEKKTNVFKEYLFEKGSYCFVGVFTVRMDYFDKCNPKRNLFVSSGGQNYQLLLPILYKGRCGYIDKVVYNYRIRDNSHSHIVKAKKDKIDRCNVHQETIFKTFDNMYELSLIKKIYYKFRVMIKYWKRKIIILFPSSLKRVIKKVKS